MIAAAPLLAITIDKKKVKPIAPKSGANVRGRVQDQTPNKTTSTSSPITPTDKTVGTMDININIREMMTIKKETHPMREEIENRRKNIRKGLFINEMMSEKGIGSIGSIEMKRKDKRVLKIKDGKVLFHKKVALLLQNTINKI
jgi:hypothetical protein